MHPLPTVCSPDQGCIILYYFFIQNAFKGFLFMVGSYVLVPATLVKLLYIYSLNLQVVLRGTFYMALYSLLNFLINFVLFNCYLLYIISCNVSTTFLKFFQTFI